MKTYKVAEKSRDNGHQTRDVRFVRQEFYHPINKAHAELGIFLSI